MQEEDVQGVTLDPLTAIQQPPHEPDLVGHRDAESILHGQAGAHLIGDRADPADPGGDVRRLGVVAPAQ